MSPQTLSQDSGNCFQCGISQDSSHAMYGRALLRFMPHITHKDDKPLICWGCLQSRLNGERDHRLHYQADARSHVEDAICALSGCARQEVMAHPDFRETGRRVSSFLGDHFRSPLEMDLEITEVGGAIFPKPHVSSRTLDDMVVVRNIRASGLCPHHLLPVKYQLAVGYLPKHFLIGLSKLPRAAEIVLRKPATQEEATRKLAQVLVSLLETPDVAVIARGEHLCMQVRGAKQPQSDTVTSVMLGLFREDEAARAELLNLINNHRG